MKPNLGIVSKRWTILFISTDDFLYWNLRLAANAHGHLVVKVKKLEGVLIVWQAIQPTTVLLDLDFPQQEVWRAAELLLQQQTCPPVVLLTAQTGQFELGTEIRAGSLVDKNEGPSRILQAVEESLAHPATNQVKPSTIQRVLIRRPKPSTRTSDFAPAYRFWAQ